MSLKQPVRIAALILAVQLSGLTHVPAETVSFQQEIDGYRGTVDMAIKLDDTVIEGAFTAQYFLDGRWGTDADTQGLLRFDNIIGSEPGQIPPGSTILSAQLGITTGNTSSNAQTGGPYGVARLLESFDEFTVYSDFSGGLGASFSEGHASRPAGGYNGARADELKSADVRPLVQAWADGEPNEGFVILASTTDGWQISSASDEIGRAPKLTVEYTTASTETFRFQDERNDYADTTAVWLQDDDVTTDGLGLDQRFLDGTSFDAPESADDQMLVRFDNIFGSNPNQVSPDATIGKAWLVITSGNTSDNTQSRGPYDAHQMLVDWDFGTKYSDFGPDGPAPDDGSIGPALDSEFGMTPDSEAWFDVTDAVVNWQQGQPNYGFNIQSGGTTDGWQVNWLGTPDPSVRPALVVTTIVGEGRPALQPGDADQDLDFDQLDLVQVQIAAQYLSGQPATWGEGDWDGTTGGEQGNPPAGDGQFNQLDIIAALSSAKYLTGPYAAIALGGQEGDGRTSIGYNATTGQVWVDPATGTELTSINIESASGIFTGDPAASLGGSFDNDADNNIFKATFGGSFGRLEFGAVAQTGLSEQFVATDLTVVGSMAGGGDLGQVDLIYVPEPTTCILLLVGAVALLSRRKP